MSANSPRPTELNEWKLLEKHQRELADVHLRELFAQDPVRSDTLSLDCLDLYVDFSKNRLTAATLQYLLAFARRMNLEKQKMSMFSGANINSTENRAALHIALRAPRESIIEVDGRNVIPDVHAVLEQMRTFADDIRSGAWCGYTGKKIQHIINIDVFT